MFQSQLLWHVQTFDGKSQGIYLWVKIYRCSPLRTYVADVRYKIFHLYVRNNFRRSFLNYWTEILKRQKFQIKELLLAFNICKLLFQTTINSNTEWLKLAFLGSTSPTRHFSIFLTYLTPETWILFQFSNPILSMKLLCITFGMKHKSSYFGRFLIFFNFSF